MATAATTISALGAGSFGAIIGWYVYYINRYRKGDVQFSDLTTVIGIIGGAAITQLFGDGSTLLFGAYGIGLATGFFGYFICLLILVAISENFDSDWFLDGRRKKPQDPYEIPVSMEGTTRPAFDMPGDPAAGGAPGGSVVIHNYIPSLSVNAPSGEVEDPAPKAAEIIEACEDEWDTNKSDCNHFAKAVATKFGVTLAGQANDITGQIQAGGLWTVLANGPAAKAAADKGKLVIGGLKGSDQTSPVTNGHVVIVVSGDLDASGKYPRAYWGQLGGVGRKNETINYAWRKGDRDKVVYASCDI